MSSLDYAGDQIKSAFKWYVSQVFLSGLHWRNWYYCVFTCHQWSPVYLPLQNKSLLVGNVAISSRFGTSKWSNEKNIRRIPVVKLRVHVGREASTIKVHTLDILEYKSQLQDAWSNIIRLENIAANTMQTPLRLTRNLVVCHNGVGIHHPTITIWLSECTVARLPWVTACCALARSPTAFPEESR